MGASCTTIKHFSVELGGNSPVLVYDDADVQMAAEKVIGLKFVNTGQVCVSPNRCYVHTSIYDAFVEAAAACAAGVDMGPMITAKARDQVLEKVDEAVQAGPLLFAGVLAWMERAILWSQRFFAMWMRGCVLRVRRCSVRCFRFFLLRMRMMRLLWRMRHRAVWQHMFLPRGFRGACVRRRGIEAGSVCVNEPHYGVQLPHGGVKQSGVGKDCSRYSLEEYLTLKRVSVLLDET